MQNTPQKTKVLKQTCRYESQRIFSIKWNKQFILQKPYDKLTVIKTKNIVEPLVLIMKYKQI